MTEAAAANSHAIVVGIERYDAGPSWNLDGPASDAVRFLEYLAGCGVPKAHTEAFLSPLPENATIGDRARSLAASVQSPTQAVLDDLIEKRLPVLTTDFLLLFWAGHGVITVDDERRLYTADATSDVKRNVDVNSLLATLRSDHYPNLPRQAVIVDACANYIPNATERLTQKTYTTGAGLAGVEQFALYAASPGEYAKNLNDEKTGLLSRELLAILTATNGSQAWPPNLAAAADTLAARFTRLRQDRKTRQTPSTFWFRSPTRNGEFKDEQSGKYLSEMRAPAPVAQVRVPRTLTNPETKVLLDAFLKLETMRRQKDRDWIVRQLRPEIGTTIERRDSDRLDTLMILSRSRYYDGLLELLESISTLEAESPAFRNVMAIAHQMLPDEVPAPLEE